VDSALRGRARGASSLPRLLASRREAESIARAAQGADVAMATGFDANRAAAEKALAEANTVVHFATHGILNDAHPLLSGIVTSLVDAGGQRQDGFLRAQDLYELPVRADLVVLSACETALGRLLGGEGITGLVHALLHAGAGAIVASNWRVDDAATQELMAALYGGLLFEGRSLSAALRAAQLRLLSRSATRAPFYWAAFEVHGLSPRFVGDGGGSAPPLVH
jgi:CHAT domain-containing protein